MGQALARYQILGETEPNPTEQQTIEGTYLFYYWIEEQLLTVLYKKTYNSDNIEDKIHHLVIHRHLEFDGNNVIVDKLWYASPHDGLIYVPDEGVLDEKHLARIREHLPVRMICDGYSIFVMNARPLPTKMFVALTSSEKAKEWWKRVENADGWPTLDATHNTGHITDRGTNEVPIAWERPPAVALPADPQSPSPINQFVVLGLDMAVKSLRVKRHSRGEARATAELFRRSDSPADPMDWHGTLYLHWLLLPAVGNVEDMELSGESGEGQLPGWKRVVSEYRPVDVIVEAKADEEVELITMAHSHAPSMQRFLFVTHPSTLRGQSY